MNWGSVYTGSNNAYSNLPPMMSDGRNFSNLLPSEVIDNTIKTNAGIQSNWDYRRYLQNNANHIIKQNSDAAISAVGLVENPSNNIPFHFFGPTQPQYIHPESDLKAQYMSREQLNSRLVAPNIHIE